MTLTITEPLVRKLLATVDAGLTYGVGHPVPGQMCVEAAISFALGEPHSDGPSCVARAVREAKIRLNDSRWSSNMARAKGMRRAAIAQLGSKGVVDDMAFTKRLTELTIREVVPIALRAAAKRNPKHAAVLEAAAVRCEQEGTGEAARAAQQVARAAADAPYAPYAAYAPYVAYAAAAAAAYAAAYDAYAAYADAYAAYAVAYAAAAADAAYAAERDRILSLAAEIQVRVLQELKSPGCEWLWLCDDDPTRREDGQ